MKMLVGLISLVLINFASGQTILENAGPVSDIFLPVKGLQAPIGQLTMTIHGNTFSFTRLHISYYPNNPSCFGAPAQSVDYQAVDGSQTLTAGTYVTTTKTLNHLCTSLQCSLTTGLMSQSIQFTFMSGSTPQGELFCSNAGLSSEINILTPCTSSDCQFPSNKSWTPDAA